MSAAYLEGVMQAQRQRMSLVTEAERERMRAQATVLRRGRKPRFAASLLARPTAIIAEFKRRSPSAGAIQAAADPQAVARMYEQGGAAAMSVLTVAEHFGGSLDDLRDISQTASLPLLRKDFLVDPHQVFEAAIHGAEAILVIVAGVSDDEARALLEAAELVKLDALVEVHTTAEMQRAVLLGARLIGVNNRNLHTLKTDINTSLQLANLAPRDALLVAESGLRTRHDITRLQAAGYRAFLIGETLMRSADPLKTLRELQGEEAGEIKVAALIALEEQAR